MKKYILLIFLFSSLFAKDKITWVKWDFPPSFILEGELKGQGWADKQLKILQEHLPQYSHTEVIMNAQRFLKIFKTEQNSKNIFCANNFISHPDLNMDDYLSIATFPYRGHLLVTRKEKAYLFGKKEESLLLKDIIQNRKLNLVIAKNRPYLGAGKVISEYLKENPDDEHINALSTHNISESMFQMVLKNRADYTLEYDFRVKYYSKKFNAENKIVIFPIKENAEIMYGYATCIKSPQGKQVIEEVNTIIRSLRSTTQWINLFKEWIPTQKLQNEYTSYYENTFLPQGDIYDDNPRSR